MIQSMKNALSILLLLLLASCANHPQTKVLGDGYTSTGMCEDPNYKRVNEEAIPCLIKQPRYPRSAAEKGVEGSVTFSFAIEASGKPVDIKIIKSVPEGVFDKYAMAVIHLWSFKPKTADGSAIRQENMTYEMHFNLR